jgi:chromosome segregation ATPase
MEELQAVLNKKSQIVPDLEVEIRGLRENLHKVVHRIDKFRTKRVQLRQTCEKLEHELRLIQGTEPTAEPDPVAEARAAATEALQTSSAQLKEATDALKSVEKQVNSLESEFSKLKKELVAQKKAEEAASLALAQYERLVALAANPRNLGIDLEARDARRAARKREIADAHAEYIRAREEGQDTADARQKLLELKVRETSIDGQPDEEEDESELTADELLARIAHFRADRVRIRNEIEETKKEHERVVEELSEREWRVTAIREVLQGLAEQELLTLQ